MGEYYKFYSGTNQCLRDTIWKIIHIGQGGIQSGLSVWELMCEEQSINHDGTLNLDMNGSGIDNSSMDTLSVFFHEKLPNVYTPRAIMVDFDSDVIDSIKTGCMTNFDQTKMISGKENAEIFAKGHYSYGKYFLEPTLDLIRKAVNETDKLNAIFVFNSLGGGTGSGFGSLLIESILQDYSKKARFEYGIHPFYDSIEPSIKLRHYNALLSIHKNIDSYRCSVLFGNQVMFRLCQKRFNFFPEALEEVNRLIATVLSAILGAYPLQTFSFSVNEVQICLLPYPRAHFPIIGIAPIMSETQLHYERLTVPGITKQTFDYSNQLMDCNPYDGVAIGCCLFYRGDVNENEAYSAMNELKSKKNGLKFMDVCSNSVKVVINNQRKVFPPHWGVPEANISVCSFINSTAIQAIWTRLTSKVTSLLQKKAYLHWYLQEGLEEQEFDEAITGIQGIVQEYQDMEDGLDVTSNKSSKAFSIPPSLTS